MVGKEGAMRELHGLGVGRIDRYCLGFRPPEYPISSDSHLSVCKIPSVDIGRQLDVTCPPPGFCSAPQHMRNLLVKNVLAS